MQVVFTGDPRPTLTWFINGEEMKDSEEITIVTTHNTSILVIKSFTPEKHIGEIICKAENEAGEVSCTASMGVNIISLSLRLYVSCVNDVRRNIKHTYIYIRYVDKTFTLASIFMP